MGKRRANSEGNVYQRPNGRWEARLRYTDPTTGQPKRVSVYADTQKGALAELDKVRKRITAGQPPRDATTTVGAWMAHWRDVTLAASSRKPATQELYGALSKKHVEQSVIGQVRLDRLRPSHVEKLIIDMRSQTKPGKVTPECPHPAAVRALSDSTIRSTYVVLRAGLDAAVRDGLLGVNPATLVPRPGVARREAVHLEQVDLARLLDAARESSRYYPAIVLAATTGMRRGEIAALKWRDIDLAAGVLRVSATTSRIAGQLVVSAPKTERSRRAVPVPAAVVDLLRAQRVSLKKDRLRAGDQWREHGLVFPTEFGTPVDPRSLLRVVQAAARRAGLPETVGVHTLRHSAATGWLEAGVHIRAVGDLLGHSSVAVTGDVYGHVTDSAGRGAVEGLAGRLGL